MTFFELIENWDRELFFTINSMHHPILDQIMSVISSRMAWIPAYLFLAWWVFRNFGLRTLGITLLSVAVLILFTDTGSTLLFKDLFQRYRPCHNLEIKDLVHVVDGHCGGQFGFISSHAANFFGMAMLFSLLMKGRSRHAWMILFSCAALVAYSRIYLGVHYPSDVFVGALFGMTGGFISYLVFQFLQAKYNSSRS